MLHLPRRPISKVVQAASEWLPYEPHVRQRDEEVGGEAPLTLRKDAVLGATVVGTHHAHAAEQHRHLRGGQPHELGAIEHQLLSAHVVVILQPVAEGIVQWLKRSERDGICLRIERIAAPRSERKRELHARSLRCTLHAHIAGQNNGVRNTRSRLFGEWLQDGEGVGEASRLVPLPIALGSEADARTVCTTTLV